jgi:hypothetical protein
MPFLVDPRWPARGVAGTTAYITVCRAWGINRFCVLFPPQGSVDREPWREFHRTLPESKAPAR